MGRTVPMDKLDTLVADHIEHRLLAKQVDDTEDEIIRTGVSPFLEFGRSHEFVGRGKGAGGESD